MKKILCMILALACVFAFASCNNGGGDDSGVTAKTLEDVVKDSAPTRVKSFITYSYGDDFTLDAEYSLSTSGNDAIFSYSYEVLPELGAGISNIETKSGVIYYKDGKFSIDGDTWGGGAVAPTESKLDLVRSAFKIYNKSEDGRTLTATTTGANMESVIGNAIEADGDVTIVVVTNGVYLTGVTITYKSTAGADVVIETSYTYNPLTLEFPSADEN